MDETEFLSYLVELDLFRKELREEISNSSRSMFGGFGIAISTGYLSDECRAALVRVVANILHDNIPSGWTYTVRHDTGRHEVFAAVDP